MMPPLKFSNILLVLFILSSFAAGFFAGKIVNKSSSITGQAPSLKEVNGASLFASQSATIQGKITKIEGESLVIEDTKGRTATFKYLANFVVTNYPNKSGLASNSGTLKSVKLDTEAVITLHEDKGEYKVSNIYYTPPPPPFPTSTTSATTQPSLKPGQ